MVVVSPSVPPVCVEDEDRGGGLGSSAGKTAGTVFAALTAAASVENCEGLLCQFPLACKPSKGLLVGNDEDGRWSVASPVVWGGTTLADLWPEEGVLRPVLFPGSVDLPRSLVSPFRRFRSSSSR